DVFTANEFLHVGDVDAKTFLERPSREADLLLKELLAHGAEAELRHVDERDGHAIVGKQIGDVAGGVGRRNRIGRRRGNYRRSRCVGWSLTGWRGRLVI